MLLTCLVTLVTVLALLLPPAEGQVGGHSPGSAAAKVSARSTNISNLLNR